MKRDLWSSKNPQGGAGTNDAARQADAQSVIEQYGGMDESQLMQQLRTFRQSGQMDDAALEQMAQAVSPMLSGEQRTKLQALMQQLRQ